MNSKTTNILLVVAIILVVILIGVGLWLIFQGTSGSSAEPTATPVPPTPIAEIPTATAALPTATVEQIVIIPATATPIPTDAPTDTPVPTDTPIPTETPLPTSTPVPIIYPTATPIPPTPRPTNTPGPPPGPQPVTINGLSATHFALQDRSNVSVNGKIWTEFKIVNSSGGNVSYSTIGVVPRKDGNDRWDFFKKSWGGNDDKIDPNGLRSEDNMYISEAGDYTLRLVICFDDYTTCRAGGGTHHTLSHEIPITLN